MNFKTLVIPDYLDKKLEDLKKLLGERSKWAVIQKAIFELEKKTDDPTRMALNEIEAILYKYDIPTTRNTTVLLSLILKTLTANIDDEEKEKVIIRMIKAGTVRE